MIDKIIDKLYVVEYNGLFGFIKPYSSFRDSSTFSQQFLTKSHLIGIEFKIFSDDGYIVNGDIQRIVRHKLSHSGFCSQQEAIQSSNIKIGKESINKSKAKNKQDVVEEIKEDVIKEENNEVEVVEGKKLKEKKIYKKVIIDGGIGIIKRHVLLKPKLLFGFKDKNDAEIMIENMVRLTRNEDLMVPNSEIIEMSNKDFDLLTGTEAIEDKNGFLCGYNRFKEFEPMLVTLSYNI